uniref:Uncharacterized protein n=1 Tax=Caenorhabditis tropicalis TaxID=1561998 RepID=A0A1I7U5A0_9PELO
MNENEKPENILSEFEKLRLETNGMHSILGKMPSTSSAGLVSNGMLEEMKNEQMKFNKEVLETLQLMRQEIKDNQEKMKEEQKESEKRVMGSLQLMRQEIKENQKELKEEQEELMEELKQETMNSLRSLMTEMKTMKAEQTKVQKNRIKRILKRKFPKQGAQLLRTKEWTKKRSGPVFGTTGLWRMFWREQKRFGSSKLLPGTIG